MKEKLSTMAKNDLGRTIIDELRLCYSAESTLLDELSRIRIGEYINYRDFSLFRVVSKHFKYAFDVLYSDLNDNKKVATLRYGHYVEQEQSTYVYYRIENEILYNESKMKVILTLPDMLGMNFLHITSIDLARDYKYNVVQRIRKTAKDKEIKVIVNGKVVEKEKDIREGMFVFPLNFKKLSNPTITVKQAKAIKDKTKGLTLCGYNKNKEIESSSHKEYIKEYYGKPKSLHRLEVHQNNDEIKDFCKSNAIVQDVSLIFNQNFLDNMYNAHLSSLLRFTKGRKKVSWDEILH
jgi:hypothetical protein